MLRTALLILLTTLPLSAQIRVLIIDGVNNHDWVRGTQAIKAILESSGLFRVDVSTTQPAGAPREAWEQWHPNFFDYQVLVNNFNGGHTENGTRWPAAMETQLENYVRRGGGLVNVHAANNGFPQWENFNRMIALGWREPSFGPSIVIDPSGLVVRVPAGSGLKPGHGPAHTFQMTTRVRKHPITSGLPEKWMHPDEQLTHGQHGPAVGLNILTYAYSKDVKENEPMDWTLRFGRGRVYTTMLGHIWKNTPAPDYDCVGFQTLLIRGVEWAASGKVSYPVPREFPTATQVGLRKLWKDPLELIH